MLSGLANKEIVAAINSNGGRATGVSGADGALIQCRIKNRELGFVGEVVKVDTTLLDALLQAGYIVVVSPISLHVFDKQDDAPNLLNVNGDVVAGGKTAANRAGRGGVFFDGGGVCWGGGGRLA